MFHTDPSERALRSSHQLLRSFLCFHLYLEVIFNWSSCFHCRSLFSFLNLFNFTRPHVCTLMTALALTVFPVKTCHFQSAALYRLAAWPSGLFLSGRDFHAVCLLPPPCWARIMRQTTSSRCTHVPSDHSSDVSWTHRGRDPSLPGLTYSRFSPCITSFPRPRRCLAKTMRSSLLWPLSRDRLMRWGKQIGLLQHSFLVTPVERCRVSQGHETAPHEGWDWAWGY